MEIVIFWPWFAPICKDAVKSPPVALVMVVVAAVNEKLTVPDDKLEGSLNEIPSSDNVAPVELKVAAASEVPELLSKVTVPLVEAAVYEKSSVPDVNAPAPEKVMPSSDTELPTVPVALPTCVPEAFVRVTVSLEVAPVTEKSSVPAAKAPETGPNEMPSIVVDALVDKAPLPIVVPVLDNKVTFPEEFSTSWYVPLPDVAPLKSALLIPEVVVPPFVMLPVAAVVETDTESV
jgi:hypothetical protein